MWFPQNTNFAKGHKSGEYEYVDNDEWKRWLTPTREKPMKKRSSIGKENCAPNCEIEIKHFKCTSKGYLFLECDFLLNARILTQI